jgi:UDP-N-acetylmuramoyl-tripeptide--D-alanyl-D-alanine ligase
MVAAVNTFVSLYPNSVVVLGDMNELGEHEIELHKQVGQQIKGDAAFLTVGELAKYIGVGKHFDTNSEISRYILANFAEGTTIFLKASRAMKLEEIIEGLKT